MKVYVLTKIDGYIPYSSAYLNKDAALKEAKEYAGPWDNEEINLSGRIYFNQEEEGNMEQSVSLEELELTETECDHCEYAGNCKREPDKWCVWKGGFVDLKKGVDAALDNIDNYIPEFIYTEAEDTPSDGQVSAQPGREYHPKSSVDSFRDDLTKILKGERDA